MSATTPTGFQFPHTIPQLQAFDVEHNLRSTGKENTANFDKTVVLSSELAQTQVSTTLVCEDCGVLTRDFCIACNMSICETCWLKQLPHRKGKAGAAGAVHQKIDKLLVETISNILNPPTSEEDLKRLHEEDYKARWFEIHHKRSQDPTEPTTSRLRIHQRFEDIMEPICRSSSSPKYPSIVSFIGETFAGKSTLIKALIETSTQTKYIPVRSVATTPVVSGASDDDTERAASSGVHLYHDPQAIDTSTPILFADCEGLGGGNISPAAERYRKADSRKDKQARIQAGSADSELTKPRDASWLREKVRKTLKTNRRTEKEIYWAIEEEKQTRQYAVKNIYPRILYAFSDTIVFVMKNSKKWEEAVQTLIEWAESALEYSKNQPTLPSAIIVFNSVASPLERSEAYWDPEVRTNHILSDSNDSVLENNSKFKGWVKKWEARGSTITTLKELICQYYTAVRVIAIPEGTVQPALINDQIQALHKEIIKCSIDARARKRESRMCLTYERVLPYMKHAFTHFADSAEEPFNFIDVTFRENPIPEDFSGGILHLLIAILDNRHSPRLPQTHPESANGLDEMQIIREACEMIASAIMLDSTRNGKIGTAEQIFSGYYLDHLRSAFDKFQNHYYPCEFQGPTGLMKQPQQCINKRAGHRKGHQSDKGTIIGPGEFQSKLDETNSEEFFNEIFHSIYEALQQLQAIQVVEEDLHNSTQELGFLDSDHEESDAYYCGWIHQPSVLSHFHRKFPELKSNAFCLACVIEKPRYALRCGHSICETCVKCFGESQNSIRYVLEDCPICGFVKDPYNEPEVFYVAPSDASPCVLSLDGGGVRGIIQLEALRQIEKAIGLQIPIREFFDLIVGTSCGGIIALGIGVVNWPVEDCAAQFTEFAQCAFQKRTGGVVARAFHKNSLYETKPLESVLRKSFGERTLFSYNDNKEHGRNVAVAITATTEINKSIVFGNYNRKAEDYVSNLQEEYEFFTPVDPKKELFTWQVARATSAAPTYFKPFSHTPSGLVLHDGGLLFNNPAKIAYKEWKRIARGPSKTSVPDVFLSLGTGFRPTNKEEKLNAMFDFVPEAFQPMFKILYYAMKKSIDSNLAWESFMKERGNRDPDNAATLSRIFRLNLQLPKKIELSDHAAIPELKQLASQHFQKNAEIKDIANRLIASLFYFHLESIVESDDDFVLYTCKGSIRCRLQYRACWKLAQLFEERLPAARFLIESRLPPQIPTALPGDIDFGSTPEKEVRLSPQDIKEFCEGNTTKLWELPVEFVVAHRASQTSITFATERSTKGIPSVNRLGLISAFPRELVREHEGKSHKGASVSQGFRIISSQNVASSDASINDADSIITVSPIHEAARKWKPNPETAIPPMELARAWTSRSESLGSGVSRVGLGSNKSQVAMSEKVECVVTVNAMAIGELQNIDSRKTFPETTAKTNGPAKLRLMDRWKRMREQSGNNGTLKSQQQGDQRRGSSLGCF